MTTAAKLVIGGGVAVGVILYLRSRTAAPVAPLQIPASVVTTRTVTDPHTGKTGTIVTRDTRLASRTAAAVPTGDFHG